MQPTENKVSSVDEKNRLNEIPNDAFNLEVFAIKNSEADGMQAYIGFKIPNGNFNFVQVPYTQPQPTHTIGIDEDELDKIFLKWANENTDVIFDKDFFKAGYKAANSKGCFSLEDIAKAWDAADNHAEEQAKYPYGKRDGIYQYPNKEQYLKSLSK